MRLLGARHFRLAFHIVVASLASAAAMAGENAFTPTGPFGGAVTAIAVQPGQPNVVLASSARGTYRSTDAGGSWTVVQPDMGSYSEYLSFDPLVPSRVFTIGSLGQVWRSTDSGQSFSQVSNFTGWVDRISVAGSRVYAASSLGPVYRSEDGGATWTTVPVPWNTTNNSYKLYGLVAAPSNSSILFVCIQETGTFKSVDAGANWTGPIAGSPCTGQFNYTFQYAVSPVDPNRVLAATSDGLFLSTNGGTNWNVVYTPPFIQSLYFDPLMPDNVLGLDSLGLVMRSFDGGFNWLFSNRGADLDVYNLLGGAFTGDADGDFWAATSNGPMYSTDNGASFTARFNGIRASDARELIASDDGTVYAMFYSGPAGIHRRSPAGTWTSADNAELVTRMTIPLNVMDIATGAANSSLLYLADQGAGVWRSDNGGDDWTGPLPSLSGVHQIFGIDVDPTNPQVIYASRANGGIVKSTNGGQTFLNCGLPQTNNTTVRRVYISRSSPDVLYAFGAYSSIGSRTWKSVDGCATWAELTPSTGSYLYDVAIDPVDANRLFRTHIAGAERSNDGGATWTPVSFNFGTGLLGYGVRLLIDPVERNTLWVVNSNQAGFARSVDDGATWQKAVHTWHGNQAIFEAAVLVPGSPDTLVAVSRSMGIVEYTVSLDLEAGLTLPSGTVFAGTQLAATATVRNAGSMDASPARVTVTLPAFVTVPFVPAGCTLTGSALTCRTAHIPAGQTVNIPMTLAVSGVAAAGNVVVTVNGHESDPVFTNDSVTGSLSTVARADLRVSAPADATIGRTTSTPLAFTLTNQGPDAAANVRVTFTTPVGLDATTATLAGGTCAVGAQLVTCTVGSLAANASVAVQLGVSGAAAGAFTVNAQAASDGVDDDTDQNAAASVTVRPYADLAVELSAAATTRDVGVAFTYTVTVRNLGPDTARPVADFAVTGATISASSTTTGICGLVGGATRCELNDLASGGSTTVSLTLNTTAAGTASVQADVSWTGLDAVSTNNRATLNTTIVTPPPPPPAGGSSSGGGGGGGRFDWLALLLLSGAITRAMARRLLSVN